MTPEQLKNSILQLAIQGKLVEQRAEEGTAEELYQQIQAEKKRLIKEGKIKKEKPLPGISEDEKPFDIPESWKWVRISDLGEVIGGGTPKTENAEYWDKAEIPWLTPADMKFIKGKYAERGERNISDIGLKNSSARLMPKGTVLYSSRAPIGYIAIAANRISTNQGFKSLVPAITDINEFIFYSLMARTSDIVSRASGTTFKEISGTEFSHTILPLPPLAEQKRIVAKIEELLPFIDRYGQAWTKLEDFNKRFPTDIQKSILQLAIQGKLVEQRSEEGTGEELYQKIQTEKLKLIKEGKIKKEKPLSDISEDEKLFDIPDSWLYVHLDDIVQKNIKRGKSPKYTTTSNTLVFAQKCNAKSGEINMSLAQLLDESTLSKYPSDEFLRDSDIIVNSTGNGTLGRIGIFKQSDNITNQQIVPDSHVTIIRASELISTEYVFLYLKSNQPYLERMGTGSTNQTELNPFVLKTLIVPLPPLAEQKRIVAKLEEILPLCEKLKK